jgi:hypothetical protein
MVAGPVIETFLIALGAYRARGEKVVARTMRAAHLDTAPGRFYPLQNYLDVLAEFQKQFGEGFLQRMGSHIFEKAEFPPGIDSLESALAAIDVAYNMNHENAKGKIGGYCWKPNGERDGVMVCDNPYPCSFDVGILETVARRFQPGATVVHQRKERCRHVGGESCSYHVEW